MSIIDEAKQAAERAKQAAEELRDATERRQKFLEELKQKQLEIVTETVVEMEQDGWKAEWLSKYTCRLTPPATLKSKEQLFLSLSYHEAEPNSEAYDYSRWMLDVRTGRLGYRQSCENNVQKNHDLMVQVVRDCFL